MKRASSSKPRATGLADRPGNEWQVEEGIGEHRAILCRGGEIVAARIDWPGKLAAGQVEDAVLVSRAKGSSRGTARFASGEEALVDRLPKDAREGAAIRLEIHRPALREQGRSKMAQARPTSADPCPAPTLAEALRAAGHAVRIVHRFTEGDWNALWLDAWHGRTEFAGGELAFFPTPAMTLVDVDGTADPRSLALAAAEALGSAIARFDLAGSIGVDFPTLQAKADRKAVDERLEGALDGWPHERTAMNGFGFVQLVARLERASLLHRIAGQRTAAAARALLRHGEAVEEPGELLLTCHPGVGAALRDDWLEELARRSGRRVRIETRGDLALEAGFAQAVQP